jgi:phosphate transport system substrate-binding protein
MLHVLLALLTLAPTDAPAVAPRGAGATSAFPLYSKWIREYRKKTKIKVDYQAGGSRAGAEEIKKGTVDFGATESPISDEDAKVVPGGLVHVPVAVAGLAVVYNLEGVAGLRLSPGVIADIWKGKITKWNDPRLKKENPKLKLPAEAISVIYGQGGGTFVFTDYLSTIDEAWKAGPGKGTKVAFPAGKQFVGADRIAEAVKSTKGAIAYLDAAFAHHYKLPWAAVKNKAGKFVEPKPDALSASAAAMCASTKDLRLSMVDATGDASYPIVSFTYAVVHKQPKDAARGKAVVDFLRWATQDGQKTNAVLGYTTLPPIVVEKVGAALDGIK